MPRLSQRAANIRSAVVVVLLGRTGERRCDDDSKDFGSRGARGCARRSGGNGGHTQRIAALRQRKRLRGLHAGDRVRNRGDRRGHNSGLHGTSGSLPLTRREIYLDLSLRAVDRLDADLDRVAEPVRAASAAPPQRRPEVVQLEVVAWKLARGQEALVDLAEADEDPGADGADDLAIERLLPPALEQQRVEQPREADRVRLVLDRRGGALAL